MGKINIAYEGNLRTEAVHVESGAVLKTDALNVTQGKGEAFSPTDLLAVSLGSCVMTLMGMAAQKLNVELTGLCAEVEKEMASAPVRRIGRIVVEVYCPLSFDVEKTMLIEKAGRGCPVHHSLHPDVEQVIRFHWGKE